jgi:hypothetical protein
MRLNDYLLTGSQSRLESLIRKKKKKIIRILRELLKVHVPMSAADFKNFKTDF